MRTLLWLTWVAALCFGWLRAQGTGWALALLAFGGLATLFSVRWCVHDAYQTAVKLIAIVFLLVLTPITLGNWADRAIEQYRAPDDLDGVSYAELREALRDGALDPVGASRIFVRRRHDRDGWDYWYKMTIGEEDYRALWGKHWGFTQDRLPTARPLAQDVRAIPTKWPQATDAPGWFGLPAANSEWNGWEFQLTDAPGDYRARGSVWVYETGTQSLYIWDWNHQHRDLGW